MQPAGRTWLDLILRKNADYGSSVWTAPALKPDMDAGDAILVRMSDKVSRIAALQSSNAQVDESLEDSIRDLGAYALLWLARPELSEQRAIDEEARLGDCFDGIG